MKAFHLLAAAAGVVLAVYGCGGDESLNQVTSSSAGGGNTGGAGGVGGGTGGNGGLGASTGDGGTSAADGGSNAGGSSGGSTPTSSGGGTSAGGATGAGGETFTGTGFGGGGPPPQCTTQNDTCPPGKYCFAPGCGPGVCRRVPMEGTMSNDADLVCGCDGVTYWNAHMAAHGGASVAMAGACPGASGPPCSNTMPCAAGLTCNVQVSDATQCLPSAPGVCWGIPSQCPLSGAKGKACTDGSCQYQCALIASQHPWYDDGLCP